MKNVCEPNNTQLQYFGSGNFHNWHLSWVFGSFCHQTGPDLCGTFLWKPILESKRNVSLVLDEYFSLSSIFLAFLYYDHISPTALSICSQPGHGVSGKPNKLYRMTSSQSSLKSIHCNSHNGCYRKWNVPFLLFDFSILIYERWHSWKVKVESKSTG